VSADQSRRAFLKRSAVLSMAGTAAPFVTNLACIGEAAAAVATDYKALVCVFLYGGNDYANTLTPYDQATYNAYQSLRSNIAYGRDALTPTVLTPTTGLSGGVQYALAPALLPLLPLFNGGQMAPILNLGTLIQPTTKAQYQARNVPLPPKLFSHNDQQSFFQSSATEGATSGWGGRMGDLFQSGNGSATLTCINASGNAVFLSGQNAVQYAIGTRGPIPLMDNNKTPFGSATVGSVLRSMIAAPRTQIFENEYTRVTKRSLDTYDQVTNALKAGPALTTAFPSGNFLADQLKVVAQMISVSQELGAKRQVFFVSMGGFDNHDALPTAHPALLSKVASAMKAFYDATVELGVANKVTAFTGSDFGRTLVNNTDGSDHGWGSHHFVMGGAVKGKAIYGTPPEHANNGASDVGQGRLLPTTSVDQYAATLAKWFGVTDSQMSTVLPNIANYNASTRDIGFMI
jgi:uncharacterized protein (DUF1501 family)